MNERPATRLTSDRAILVAFLAIALVLRLPGHLNSGLWFDEIWMLIESVRVPFTSLFTTFESDNNHPLYSILTWPGVRLFGEHAWTLRLPAVLFGVASIGMMWTFARLVTDRAEAALATALLTVSYHHVWFSQNARGYTMLLFWTLAATYFLLKTYAGGARRDWVLYALCLALATYTHASAVFVAIGHAGVALLSLVASRASPARGAESESGEARWAPLLGVALAGALSLGLHAGMLGDMLAFFTQDAAPAAAGTNEMNPNTPSEWTTIWWTLSAVVNSLGLPAPLAWGGLAVGAGLGVTGVAVCWRRNWRATLLYLLPGMVAVATTVGMGRSLRPRFLFHLSGFALLILVAGVFAMCHWAAGRASPASRPKFETGLKGVAAAAMLFASLAILPPAYTLPKQDFEGALAYVRSVRVPSDEVATAGLTILPYSRFYDAGFPEVATVEELDRLLAAHSSVYVLHTLPIFLETTAPALAVRLARAPEVARFRGSLGDGDVIVLRLPGSSAAP